MGTLVAPGPPLAATPLWPPVRHLVGPVVDFVCVGGLSILCLGAIHLGLPLERDVATVAWTFYYLSFVANWPHFLLSYQILYWNYRRELLTRPRFLWAGVGAPALLAGLLVAVAVTESAWGGAWLVRSMYLLVGWHYVKQAYGCFTVLSARNRYFLTDGERRVTRGAMYALWLLNFVGTNVDVRVADLRGVGYSLFWDWPPGLVTAATVAMAASALAMVVVLVRKAFREDATPPLNAIVALLSIYAWFIPALTHRVFFYSVPFFHSLQYLLFALLLTRNRAVAQATEDGGPPRLRLATYLATTVVLGVLAFKLVPEALDRHAGQPAADVTPTFWMFAFIWFINVHHYFIDNKLWLRDNAEMRYLK